MPQTIPTMYNCGLTTHSHLPKCYFPVSQGAENQNDTTNVFVRTGNAAPLRQIDSLDSGWGTYAMSFGGLSNHWDFSVIAFLSFTQWTLCHLHVALLI